MLRNDLMETGKKSVDIVFADAIGEIHERSGTTRIELLCLIDSPRGEVRQQVQAVVVLTPSALRDLVERLVPLCRSPKSQSDLVEASTNEGSRLVALHVVHE